MMGKALFLSSFCLLGFGCAEPKYAPRGAKLDPALKAVAEQLELPVSKTSAWFSWETMPGKRNFGSFLLKLGRENLADRSPIPQEIEGEVSVLLWMPSMGHGSSPVQVTKVDTGTYRASRVFFSMPGDWEIRIKRSVKGVEIEQAVLSLRF